MLGNFSVPIKSMILKSFSISSLETGEAGLVPLRCEISLLYKFVWNVMWFSISSEKKNNKTMDWYLSLSSLVVFPSEIKKFLVGWGIVYSTLKSQWNLVSTVLFEDSGSSVLSLSVDFFFCCFIVVWLIAWDIKIIIKSSTCL